MSVYLDASVLVSLFVIDPTSERARRSLLRIQDTILVSDLAASEFVSALSQRMRMKLLTPTDVREGIGLFDEWAITMSERVGATSQDFALCDAYLRRLDLPLRTPDALHIAIASRVDASILSFDKQLVTSAKKLGIAVEQV